MKASLFFSFSHHDDVFFFSCLHLYRGLKHTHRILGYVHIHMDNNMKLVDDDKKQKSNKTSTQVLIITSVDNDNDKILSYFNPSNVETYVVDLNEKNLMDVYQNKKRTLSQSEDQEIAKSMATMKRRKADLTCVVCGGHAIGYNFAQITCESCKGLNKFERNERLILISLAFFRRNALHTIEKTKCNKNKNNFNEIQCDIRSDIKHKCQRCRLLKCFQQGMRKDYILTPEQKLTKQQRLEENRRLRSDTPSHSFQPKIERDSTFEKLVNIPTSSSSALTEFDWSCLIQIQDAYLSATQSTPSASSVLTLELAPDKVSAYTNTFDIQNFFAVKLINFVRIIPEFEQLDEHDRLILVKYNLTLLFLIRHSLNFDSARELCYDLDTTDVVSPNDEAFAQHCKSLFILCYGYEFNRTIMSILHILVNIVNKDPIIVQLLMLIAIFSKGLSSGDEQEPILNDQYSVYNAQSKYIDLLFRYLLQKSSFEIVVVKMTRITEQLMKIQKVMRDFQQYIRSKVDLTHINPLMKSLLHLT
ncbi:hypothetical protein I4U23_026902 [Adineta vaga]|nr:hypothetical protein I4U23_026902 [Adineta vaga]